MNGECRARSRRWAGFLGVAALIWGIVLLNPTLRADDDGEPANSEPARAVRLSYVQGDVRLFQGGRQVVDQAAANTPLFQGTRVDTGNDGQAEIQFEDGSIVRLSPESSLTLELLRGLSATSERDAEIMLNSGLAYCELQGENELNHTKVRFDGADVTASGVAVVRLDLDKAPGEVAVFSGNVHLEGSSVPALDLHGGQSVTLNGSDPNNYSVAETIEPDSWDAWNSDRDAELTSAAANQTQATESLPDSKNPAWSDLDANGSWYDVPDQGYVWSPYDASNPSWDPYDNGYWMNSPGYGYMWVSGYPWGYMPYQCGFWNYYPAFGWGWAPGGCNPWWGGYGGWVINIGFAPPHYRYPVRPRPRNPRPMGHDPIPRALIAVNRHETTSGNTRLAPRDKTGTVMIAGKAVNPLPPVQQPGIPYNHPGPVISTRRPSANPPAVNANPPRPVFQGNDSNSRPPFRGNNPSPRPVFQGGNSNPRPIGVPAGGVTPRSGYTPPPTPQRGPSAAPSPMPRYSPPSVRPSGGSAPRPAPPPVRSAPPAPRGGGVPASGGGHPASSPHR